LPAFPEDDARRGIYGISVAAELVGTGPQNLRAYERHGLVDPERTEGGTRRYSSADLDRLRRIGELLAAGLNLAGDDVFVNIAGGMTVDEPASDLGVLAAIASSVRNRVIPPTTAMFGEVGLAGEVRGISQAALRVREAAQMGFSRLILPEANIDPSDRSGVSGCDLVGVRTVGEALDELLASR